MADAARCCSGPLRPPNQCLLLAKASCLTLPPLLLAGSKVPNSSGSADQVATRWAWILLTFPVSDACSRVTLGAVTCLWNGWCRTVLLRAVTSAQPMPAACQSFLLQPSTFAFSGCEGDPVGVNLAGVSLFRMRAHGWRWGLWRAFGTADAARCCSGPLRSPNQCLLLAKAPCFTRPPLLLGGSKVPNGSGSANQVATRWARILLGFPCFGCVLTGDAGGCDVPLEWLMPHGFAQGRYTSAQPMPAACQSFLLQPSTFAFSGCEGAKRQRLCRPSGNPVGVNLAWGFPVSDACSRVTLGAVTCLWNGWCRTVLLGAVTFAQPMPAACQSSLLHPSTFAFRGFEGAKRQRLCRPSGNPLGPNLAGVSLFRMRAHGWRWGLWRAFGMADAARFCSGPLRPPNQCLPLAKASCFNRPPLLLVGAKVPNGSGSADLVATRWAWILLGFPCFGCVLTGDAGGCDVPLERLMPHGAAQGRYVRPTNACCLPKLLASPVHLCF